MARDEDDNAAGSSEPPGAFLASAQQHVHAATSRIPRLSSVRRWRRRYSESLPFQGNRSMRCSSLRRRVLVHERSDM